jgi:hypothetical protein
MLRSRFGRALVLAYLFVSAHLLAAMAGATPIDFTGALAPTITSDDILGTAWNWVAVFSVLILAMIGWRVAPRVVRAIKSMAR